MTRQVPNNPQTATDRFPVRIGEKTFSPEFQTIEKFRKGWQLTLKATHSSGFAMCLCPGRGERRLKICRLDASDLFYLAKFPNTGEEHAVGCQFFAPAPNKSGLQGYDLGVVEHLSDGGIRVRLQKGLRQAGGESMSKEAPEKVLQGSRVSQSSMTLLGLLHLLWSEASLNRWYPKMAGKRSADKVGYWLLKQARQIRTSRMALSDALLVHARKASREDQRNKTITAKARTSGLRLICVDALARFDPQKYSMPLAKLPLSGPAGSPFSYIPQEVWVQVEKRFAREIKAWMDGRRVVVIAQIEVKDGGKNSGRICDMALMVVSDEWIPLDSTHEGNVEHALREDARSFFKPLRYDADESCVFPDFWLLDVGRDFPMEVFGMNTPTYLARKAEKTAYYDAHYGQNGWWQWNAYQEPGADAIPPFPALP